MHARELAVWRRVLRAVLVFSVLATLASVVTAQATAADSFANSAALATSVTIGPQAVAGPIGTFLGNGAIAGGGGNLRLFFDYPLAEQRRILQLMFKPGVGVALQKLKLEMGANSNSSDGTEPSVEPVRGQITCAASYELKLAQEAQEISPKLEVDLLQWAAPGWVRDRSHGDTLWTPADIDYVLTWVGCAKRMGIRISYIGGWNERGGSPHEFAWEEAWYVELRHELNTHGYSAIKLEADESMLPKHGPDIGDQLAHNAAFAHAVAAIWPHDTCGMPTTGLDCRTPSHTKVLGKPVLEGEIGAMPVDSQGSSAMARSLNRAWIQAGVVGEIVWPIGIAMPPGLPYENRGFFQAKTPWSGAYNITSLLPVMAQTTRFVRPGWRYVAGGFGYLMGSGSEVAYRAPHGGNWSVVAETTTAMQSQRLNITVAHGLLSKTVHVWSTNVRSGRRADWFVRRSDLQKRNGKFSLQMAPGYVYTISTVNAGTMGASNSHGNSTAMPLPYTARPDESNEPKYLSAQEGGYAYLPGGKVFEQVAAGAPVYWHQPREPRSPFAIIGSNTGANWRNNRISVAVRFTGKGQSAGVLGRCETSYQVVPRCDSFSIGANGSWHLTPAPGSGHTVVAIVRQPGKPGWLGDDHHAGWTTLSLTMSGHRIVAAVNGRTVAVLTVSIVRNGTDGIITGGYYPTQYTGLTIVAVHAKA